MAGEVWEQLVHHHGWRSVGTVGAPPWLEKCGNSGRATMAGEVWEQWEHHHG
jgi:hypothetical protein